ncbi:MAG: chemotaxis protein CheD [Firmicutes bacterium]|nr:chemotaxis protein CheD [[Eubacterium] siraeum]MCM1487247.1 chemotaxis protein CheD [Bacillota bacterium]
MNITVGISDWKVGKAPDIIVTYALGSCVGTCIFDKVTGICGMSHIMLPDSVAAEGSANFNRMKFADTALPDMVNEMIKKGAAKGRLQAKIAGGALMFATKSEQFNIGERNVAAVKAALRKLNIPIIASDTGLNYGRTVFFHTDEYKVVIKSTVKGINIL